jgi:hypothetical protein
MLDDTAPEYEGLDRPYHQTVAIPPVAGTIHNYRQARAQAAASVAALAQSKEERAERREGFRDALDEANTALRRAELVHAANKDSRDQALSYAKMSQEIYQMKKDTLKGMQVGDFYKGLALIPHDDPARQQKISELLSVVPFAGEDQGVRALLAEEAKAVPTTPAERQYKEDKAFLVEQAKAIQGNADHFKENPALKTLHDNAVNRALQYEQDNLGAPKPVPVAPPSAASFIPGANVARPTAPAATPVATATPPPSAANVELPLSSPANFAPSAQEWEEIQRGTRLPSGAPAPAPTPTETPAPITTAVPPPSTPKEQQQQQWATVNP